MVKVQSQWCQKVEFEFDLRELGTLLEAGRSARWIISIFLKFVFVLFYRELSSAKSFKVIEMFHTHEISKLCGKGAALGYPSLEVQKLV